MRFRTFLNVPRVLALLVTLFVASLSATPVNSVVIMPLGDSLTEGFVSYDNTQNEDGGYRTHLWQGLRAEGLTDHTFVGTLANGPSSIDRNHEGHGGWRIEQITVSVDRWMAKYQPDLILLLIGCNDLIQGRTPDTALTHLGALLDRIRTARPGARVLVGTLPGVRANSSTFPLITPEKVTAYNAGIFPMVQERAAAGWNVSVVDLFDRANIDRTSSSDDYAPDGVHPTPRGYAKLAKVWQRMIYPNFARLGRVADQAGRSLPSAVAGLGLTP